MARTWSQREVHLPPQSHWDREAVQEQGRGARKATVGLVREINSQDFRVKSTTMTLSQLAQHYRQRELRPENQEKNYSTKAGYDCYLKKWIVLRWGEHTLPS